MVFEINHESGIKWSKSVTIRLRLTKVSLSRQARYHLTLSIEGDAVEKRVK